MRAQWLRASVGRPARERARAHCSVFTRRAAWCLARHMDESLVLFDLATSATTASSDVPAEHQAHSGASPLLRRRCRPCVRLGGWASRSIDRSFARAHVRRGVREEKHHLTHECPATNLSCPWEQYGPREGSAPSAGVPHTTAWLHFRCGHTSLPGASSGTKPRRGGPFENLAAPCAKARTPSGYTVSEETLKSRFQRSAAAVEFSMASVSCCPSNTLPG